MQPTEIFADAEKLIDHFSDHAASFIADGSGGWEDGHEPTQRKNAIKISIQAVEFLLKESNRTEKPVSYWKEVLSALKSL